LALACQSNDPFVLGRANFLMGLALGSSRSHDGAAESTAEAIARFRAEAVAQFRKADKAYWTAVGLAQIGDNLLYWGDVDGAVALLDESLALHRAIADPWGIAMTLGQRAHAAIAQGDGELAARLFAESSEIANAIGDRRTVLTAVAGLAGVALTTR